jgi:hypothetical protein
MALPEKITVVLGGLRGPLGDYCDESGLSPSQVTRIALAAYLRQPVPLVPMGNPRHRESLLDRFARSAKRRKKK